MGEKQAETTTTGPEIATEEEEVEPQKVVRTPYICHLQRLLQSTGSHIPRTVSGAMSAVKLLAEKLHIRTLRTENVGCQLFQLTTYFSQPGGFSLEKSGSHKKGKTS